MWLNILLICLLGYFVNGMILALDGKLNWIPALGRLSFIWFIAFMVPFGVAGCLVTWVILYPLHGFK
jgi:hypothetical protein